MATRARIAVGVLLLALAFAVQAQSLRILAESPIAVTTVGVVPETGKEARRVVTLGIGVPASLPASDVALLNLCVNNAASTIGYQLRIDLGLAQEEAFPDSQAKMRSLATVADDVASQGDATAATYNAELNRRAALIGDLIVAQHDRVVQNLIITCGPKVDKIKAQIEVAFNVRSCPAQTSLCSDLDSNKTWVFAPSQFDKVYGWMTVAQPRKLNQWLSAKSNAAIEAANVAVDAPWPDPPSPAEEMEQLEAYINKLHKNLKTQVQQLSYLAPTLLELSKENLAQIVDVVDHPFAAALILPATGKQVFAKISDEVARSRVMDCARLRGTLDRSDASGGPPDLDAIGRCAGVKLDDAQLIQCLNALQCLPPRDAQAVAAVLSLRSAADVTDLAKNTLLPRVGRSIQKFEDLEALGRQCGTDHQNDQWAAADCVLKGSMKAEDYAAVDCVKAAGKPSGNGDKLLDCTSKLLKNPADQATLACFRKYQGTPSSALGCAALGRSPQGLQDALACAQSAKTKDPAAILAACGHVAGISEDDLKKLECFARATDNTARMLCIAKDQIPPDAQDMLGCAQSSADWKQFAGCAAAKKLQLKGQFGKAVGCAMTNGGANLGAAVCMANLQGRLTEDQLIVLQCASSSPDLSTFAVCAGGQMVVNQLLKCKGTHVGEDGCFGTSNEIRRFLKAINFDILKPGAPAARLLDFEIEVVWFQYSLAEKGIQDIGRLAENVGHELEKLGRAIGDAGDALLKGAGDAIHDIGHAIFGW
jgi:hypothetical protein